VVRVDDVVADLELDVLELDLDLDLLDSLFDSFGNESSLLGFTRRRGRPDRPPPAPAQVCK
jgi:hypothetical protein